MSKRFINGYDFTNMISAGAAVLKSQVETVNGLNVFPVPDGDTGTNMNMTMSSGAEQLVSKSVPHIGKCAEILSKGLLMGARGNSGVILSQLFRGFAKAIHDQEQINTAQFAAALQQGVDTAYQAVVKPVEGTILTVSKEAAKHAAVMARRTTDIGEFMREVHAKAKEALARTPELLPVLKQVGVVDSGGQGLVFIYEGFVNWLSGEMGTVQSEPVRPAVTAPVAVPSVSHTADKAQAKLATEDIEFLYDMEFFINIADRKTPGSTYDEAALREQLAKNGDSILIISDEEYVKVHVHSRAPGEVLNIAMGYGELSRFHIENMRDTHRALLDDEDAGQEDFSSIPVANKRFGVVSVAAGEGVSDIFTSLGVDYVLSGGQTMNPSTEDLVQAVQSVAADTVFVLPNNSNIILAAEQARELSDKEIVVIPTKTIPQGMAALLAFQEGQSTEDNKDAMIAAAKHVKSGQITFSIRDTTMDGIEIHKGDFISILDSKIVSSQPEIVAAGKALLDQMIESGEEIVTILVGEEASSTDTEALLAYIRQAYPDVEAEVHPGGQPVYRYIFSAE